MKYIDIADLPQPQNFIFKRLYDEYEDGAKTMKISREEAEEIRKYDKNPPPDGEWKLFDIPVEITE